MRLQVLLDPDSGTLNGDAERLQQVVWNLLRRGDARAASMADRTRALMEGF